MYSAVRIVNSNEATRKKPYYIKENVLYVLLDIYTNLGSTISNSTVVRHETPKTSFDEFMLDMDNTEFGPIAPDLEAIDLWLGKLGDEEDFPISKFISKGQESLNIKYKRPTYQG
jgi:hypothetical protein